MLPTLFAALSYQGINGSKNTLPEFYNNAAEIGAIIAGGAAAIYAGKDVVDVAVKSEGWAQNSIKIGTVFNNYRNIGGIQIFMFIVESFWTVATFTQVAEIGLAPFVIAYLMQTHYTNLTSTVGDEMSTIYLMWSFLSAFGSFISAWAIRESCEIMVGYFDITASEEFDAYLQSKGANFDIN